MDDMIVKSKTFEGHLEDLQEVFGILGKHGMKLNPKKCSFFIKRGKFLGYMVISKGIEPNPEKVQAIINMPSPCCVKDIQ